MTQQEAIKLKSKRRRHDPAFKAKVALEALKGVKTVQQIAAEFQIHPVQVTDWKKALLEGASGVFSGPRDRTVAAVGDEDKDRLHAKIGELTLDVDFLKKKCKQLGIATD